MTAPLWMAATPEVHSTLLSSGPGPGPLLAAAQSWTSLSTVYTDVAQELAALLTGVQGAWVGPSAEVYVAAHAPYLMWLMQAAADSAATAARQETAATAYITALATMPTLAELAANHATHAALLATNFFGINTIPIALNEADYVRMWIQAATVMSTYQAVSAAAVASSPQTTAAPQIVNLQTLVDAFYQIFPLPADTESQVNAWMEQIGFIDYWNNVLEPLSYSFYNSPFFAALFSGFDPYLPLLGNPLIFLSPFNIAFALGYPMDIGSYVAYLSQMFAFVAADLTAAFASGNPATIGFTILFATVEVIGTVITDTIALLKTLLEQTAVLLIVFVPLLTAPLVTLAAGAVAPIGLAGLAQLAAVPPAPPVAAPPVTPPLVALGPPLPNSTSSPAPVPAEAVVQAPSSGAPPPPPTPAPPTATGAGINAVMTAGMENYGYLVGDLGAVSRRAAAAGARKKAPAPDSVEEPAAAATPEEPAKTRRRRRVKEQMLGRGYEYMDLEPDEGRPVGVGAQGFSGTAAKAGGRTAAGLITLADNALGGGPRMPMMPGTWGADPADGSDD
jgi:PPE-repeat protein